MNYAQACAHRDALESACESAALAMRLLTPEHERHANGLTPDHIKATPEWRAARARYDSAFAALRAFNQRFVKAFARELRAERLARAEARQRAHA